MKKIIDITKLISLYKMGYFPMAENAKHQKVDFFLPKKRFVIPINYFHLPKKLFTEFKKEKYLYKINENFSSVIEYCSLAREKKSETWINKIIKDTFIELHKKGYAKSVECYHKNNLVGGLYGLHLGSCFFGESMFNTVSNTSKLCLIYLISILKKNNFSLLDSQFYNKHLLQFGAYEINNNTYQVLLKKGLKEKSFFPDTLQFQKSVSILQSLSHKS